MSKQLTAPDIRAAKGSRRLAMITAYDFPSARLVEEAGADMILVGDSLAMVVLGRADTLSVTMEEMLHHTRPVAAAASRALVVADMPFGSYQVSVEKAVANAVGLLSDGGARAVKVEGAGHIEAVSAMVRAGIPVQGHIGLTPQSLAELGGFKVQGRTAPAAARLMSEAKALEDAGCFSLVLECLPGELGREITAAVSIPTIGIGAGPGCDGQVLVFHDILGLFERFTPKFVKRYATLGEAARQALAAYCREVAEGTFPGSEQTFGPGPKPPGAS
jgi:3-methyl-2-oxobutanoate hydroxymethyltransferase